MLDFRPRGGSLVILIPLWRTVAGKTSEGYEVNQRRKEVWDVSLPLPWRLSIDSQIYSSLFIHEGYKWQFWRRTHEPALRASWMTFSAIGPWFCPKDMLFIDSFFFLCVAKASSCCKGSVPGKIKIKGVPGLESKNDFSISKMGGDKNSWPISWCTYCYTALPSLSGRIALRIRSFMKGLHCPLIFYSLAG